MFGSRLTENGPRVVDEDVDVTAVGPNLVDERVQGLAVGKVTLVRVEGAAKGTINRELTALKRMLNLGAQ